MLVVIDLDEEIKSKTTATIILIMNPSKTKCCSNLTFGNIWKVKL